VERSRRRISPGHLKEGTGHADDYQQMKPPCDPPRLGEPGGGPAVRFCSVVHRYRSVVALDHVDLEVARGETLALLGPNGAGKSTAISILLGLQRAQEGTISVLGTDPRAAMVSGKVGAMLQVGGGSGLPYGVKVGDLATANAISDPKMIHPGQELEIPAGGHTTAKAPQASSRGGASAPAAEVPATGQDLDSGLKTPPGAEIPVIKIEPDQPASPPADAAPGGPAKFF